ncbi:naphthoate synthase [Ligilactobacillus salitolerans]|uniref:Naphthoate synthase n=2 Tax=Ligilactobacillus salitolerans TaxID=1808352 RepID=A0A401IQT6_9LACO|nr:naphthoate synthase [Ligilactobacillus salitolerans]
MMAKYKTIILDVKDDIATLTLNRPQALNALNTQVLLEIDQAINVISANQAIKVVIVTGAGNKAFVAGADIKEMATKNAIEGQRFSELGNRTFSKLANLKQPVIAAVNGYALGGGLELALACDIRIASTNARIGQPEVGLGIIPGFGATQRLSRALGPAKAKEYILTARNVKVDEALRVGLFNKVVEPEHLLDEANQMAAQIAANAPLAVQNAKAVINEGFEINLEQGLKLEENTFGMLFATNDQKEGMGAFTEKRKAVFASR